ncbi:MAG: ATP-binding cassette domain-containing protein [Bacteroidales bacterium]|nr:ATP-binding cassette domain-containing protein [Bacteroidales bacterium]
MIRLNDISYKYPSGTQALNGITTEIRPGIHLLMGENGAGKTTLLHVLATLLPPTTGVITDEAGQRMERNAPSVLSRLSFLGDDLQWPARSIDELVKSHARFYPTFNPDLLASNLEVMGIKSYEYFDSLSLGKRKRASIAYALALGTPLLLLDETANGLDIPSKKALQKALLQSADEGRTIIVSTHTVWDLERLFDSVMMISQGNLLLNHSVGQITDRLAFISSSEPEPDALYIEEEAMGIRQIVRNDGSRYTDIDYPALFTAMLNPTTAMLILNQLNTAER